MASQNTEQFESKNERQDKPEASIGNASAGLLMSQVENFVTNPEWRKAVSEKVAVEYEHFLKEQGSSISISSSSGSDRLSQTRKIKNPNELKEIYTFMAKEWEKVQATKKRMKDAIGNAVSKKIISEKDGKFYDEKLSQNVFNGKQNITGEILNKTEKELEDSLKHREDERDEYYKMLQHPLVKNGYLAIDKNTKIKVPDQKGFLDMSVPERRKLLKQLKEQWKNAERHAEKEGSVESEKLTKEYSELLQKAKRDKLIGNKTITKYMEGFKQIDLKEKKHWLQELKNGNQLERYQKLWQDARKSLKGPALQHMEDSRDQMGYTELFIELGHTREKESSRLDNEYQGKLDHAHAQKIISKHTLDSFMNDSEKGMKSQDLSGKYRYMEEFDKQMGRYKDLRGKIDQLADKGAQKTLNEMYEDDESGFTEINKKYNELTGKKTKSSEASGEKADPLGVITNPSVKSGIKEANQLLKQQGAEKQRAFVIRLERMIVGKQANQFNQESFQERLHGMSQNVQARTVANDISVKNTNIKKAGGNIVSFQDALRQRRGIKQDVSDISNPHNKPKDEKGPGIFSFQRLFTKKRATERQSSDADSPKQNIGGFGNRQSSIDNHQSKTKEAEAMDMNAVEKNMETIKTQGNARVFQDEGFREVETAENNGEKRRLALVEINRVKGLEHWDTRNQRNEYRGQREGDKDRVAFAIRAANDSRIELKFEEICAMKQYIERDIAQGLSGAEDVEKQGKMAA